MTSLPVDRPDIFLSYGRRDRAKAFAIADFLERCGWSVWRDRTLTAGDEWEPAVLEALRAARCVVVVWSRDSVSRDWVKREALEARDLGTLVPVLLLPSGLPTPTDDVQGVRLSAWAEQDGPEQLQPLLQAVEKKVGHRSVVSPDLSDSGTLRTAVSDRLAIVEVADAVFHYCATAVEWERNRQSGISLTRDEMRRKQESYDKVDALLRTPESGLDQEDMHMMVSSFMNVLYPDFEEQGTRGAPRLS